MRESQGIGRGEEKRGEERITKFGNRLTHDEQFVLTRKVRER
jgi:hypothetical protein